jgi:hypothetical protein
MKPLDLELLRAHMESCDWESLHDSTYCALYQLGQAPVGQLIDRDVLAEVLRRLPEQTRTSALKWGFDDTVIRDNIVQHVRDRVRDAGSLEAWLEAAAE